MPIWIYRSIPSEVIFGKGVLEICNKFTGENPHGSAISINLLSSFIEITLRHRCSPVNLLDIFRTPFYNNTSGGLLLDVKEERRRDSGLHYLVSRRSAEVYSGPCHIYRMGVYRLKTVTYFRKRLHLRCLSGF